MVLGPFVARMVLLVRIPVSDGVHLHINTQYKHTGSIVTTSGSCVPAARANASSTMNAWSKLAHRVFGSPKIQTALKLSLAQSLLFSRFFFATEPGLMSRMVL